MIRDDASAIALNFLNKGIFLPSINCTHSTLIPKNQNPKSISEFWLISLCNILYKIISKNLAYRLKRVLSSIISLNQSAFILGCLTLDNIMMVYEALHSMNNRKRGRCGNMTLKLDISKAYYKVKQIFLKKIMEKLDFCPIWVGLIMQYIYIVQYSILVNGQPGETIIPTRGLRQIDLLSPYIFLLCV